MSDRETRETEASIPDQDISVPLGYCISAIELCLHRALNPIITVCEGTGHFMAYRIPDVGAVELQKRGDAITKVLWTAEYPSEENILRLEETHLGVVPEPGQSSRTRALHVIAGIPPNQIPPELQPYLQDDTMVEVTPETAILTNTIKALMQLRDSAYDHRIRVLLSLQQCFDRELALINTTISPQTTSSTGPVDNYTQDPPQSRYSRMGRCF